MNPSCENQSNHRLNYTTTISWHPKFNGLGHISTSTSISGVISSQQNEKRSDNGYT